MIGDLIVGVIVVAIAFFTYKWFELIILKKERLNIVSRLEGENLLEYAKRLPIGIKSGGVKQEESIAKSTQTPPHGKVLRWGLFMLCLGLGFIVATYSIEGYESYSPGYQLIASGWVILCGGLGLIISFIIEHLLFKKEK